MPLAARYLQKYLFLSLCPSFLPMGIFWLLNAPLSNTFCFTDLMSKGGGRKWLFVQVSESQTQTFRASLMSQPVRQHSPWEVKQVTEFFLEDCSSLCELSLYCRQKTKQTCCVFILVELRVRCPTRATVQEDKTQVSVCLRKKIVVA